MPSDLVEQLKVEEIIGIPPRPEVELRGNIESTSRECYLIQVAL